MKTIRIQKRDFSILQTLALVVLLDTVMIWRRFFPADKTMEACLRRLRLLLREGLIGKLSFPVVSVSDQPGKLLTLYRLTRSGGELLTSLTGVKPHRILRTDPRPHTLLHRRDLAGVMLAVNDAATLLGLQNLLEPKWILEQDMRAGVRPDASRIERFILYEDFEQNGETIQLRPDASTWFRFPAQSGNGKLAWADLLVWWEIDRSTEVLSRMIAKVTCFNILLRQNEPHDPSRRLYRRHWPQVDNPTLRVFFVCPSVQRIQAIAGAIRNVPGAEYVRLATLESVTPERFFADAIWYDVNGERKAIIPRTSPLTKP